MKYCCRCKKEQDLEYFNRNRSQVDGLQLVCRNCQKIFQKQFREKNKLLCILYQKTYRANCRALKHNPFANKIYLRDIKTIFNKYNNNCFFCSKSINVFFDKWELHHIKELSLGGENIKENLAPVHADCHHLNRYTQWNEKNILNNQHGN